MKIKLSIFMNLLFAILTISIVYVVILGMRVYSKPIRAYLGFPEISNYIVNSNSKLLSLLITKEDFPQIYSWSDILTTQSFFDVNNQDNYLLEQSSILFEGYIDGNTISIFEKIEKHKNNPTTSNLIESPLDKLGIKKLPPEEIRNILNINDLKKINFTQLDGCAITTKKTTNCAVLLIHADLRIELTLIVNSILGGEEVLDILNFLLTNLEEKISIY